MYINDDFAVSVNLAIFRADGTILARLNRIYQRGEFVQPMEPQKGDKIDVAGGHKIKIQRRHSDNGVLVLTAKYKMKRRSFTGTQADEGREHQVLEDFQGNSYNAA